MSVLRECRQLRCKGMIVDALFPRQVQPEGPGDHALDADQVEAEPVLESAPEVCLCDGAVASDGPSE